MATLEEPFFSISWACRISFASAYSWDYNRCKSSCRWVPVTQMHLFSDDKIISELRKSSRQCFALFSIYSIMSSVSRFFFLLLLSEFLRMLLWKSLGTFERSNATWIFSDWPLSNFSKLLIESWRYNRNTET